jgi:outer membrane protein assembly factor BamA
MTIADIYQNNGYLDASNTTPSYSEPRKLKDGYAVDVTTSITPGEVYRIARLNLQAAAPATQDEVMKSAALKVGDPASPLALRIAHGEIDNVYHSYGYLDANTSLKSMKDSTAHTVTYDIATIPGELYHYARIDTSAFTPEQQSAFTKAFHIAPGVAADKALVRAIFHATAEMHPPKAPTLSLELDRSAHTVIYTLRPAKAVEAQ